jgi:putative effector of murein hydrolase
MSVLVIPHGPVLWMPTTIGVYYGAVLVQRRLRSTPLLNPTLATILVIAAILASTKIDYET